ncbi:T9SS type A sorting domain-containing protein [Flavobacterium sp. IMCC34852]|uniref:T9SS type A sorting domain-containing protein n=1 Tax=Flavobacterium rivulicola TaxID=2732161 RepID=A0A7Y3RAI0_9FLAO|nr:T9SS type A sorting domain-containing protein [Flavobacterium sp. IMCC34852]NNT72944.1 T9SS type A sorting domain-containing protein [Flavobacterium sp. IMCC34852]
MKKHYLMLFALFSLWQINAQVLNQNAGWPNPAWTVTGTYSAAVGALESNPTSTANFAFDDDDAGNPSADNIAAESPVIDLTPAFTAGETLLKVDVQYGYRYLAPDVLRFEYWNADTAAWVAWGGNIPGNNTTVTDLFCSIPKTAYTTSILNIASFTPTQLSGFKYRIAYDDNPDGGSWNWGFCFNSPVLQSIPPPCLTGFNFPSGVFTPSTCDGLTPNQVSDVSYAGDYFTVAVTNGQTYKFTSSVPTDYFTISTDNGASAAAFGTQPLTWVSTVTGNIRVHINTNPACGTEDADRTTNVICGVLCLTGNLYPTETLTADTCDGTTVNVPIDDAWAGEYSNVEVFSANTYTFSTSIATDYLTITSADGLTAFAVGTGSVVYTPTANGTVRFYIHTDAACGTSTTARERRIVCTTAAVLPGCATAPVPADGSTTVPAFATFDLSWTAPTTGDPATSYDVYTGTAVDNLVFGGNFTTTTIPNVGPVGEYSFTIYWQVIARNAAGEAIGCSIWSFTTEAQPTDTVDYANLQWPPTASIVQGGNTTVYGRVYEPGLTDTTSGQAPGVLAWVGISPVGDNSNPNTWTTWIPATFNVEAGNDDEYQAVIGTALAPGTYYYATRFTLNGGPFVYGGINASPPNNGNFWDGATFGSGVLTVTPAPAPANDECSGAIALTAGGVFGDYDIDSSNIASTLSTQTPNPSCGNFNFTTSGKDVWYSVVVPASGTLTIETSTTAVGGAGMDTVIQVYSGDCNALVAVNCDDDGSPETAFGLTRLALTGQTPGATLLIRLFGYNGTTGSYSISAYDASLSGATFDNASFSYYPNPVKNVLNLSYSQAISNVEVYNLLGQKMIANTIGANQGQVDMSNLASGTYIVKVTADNQIKTIKVIKE